MSMNIKVRLQPVRGQMIPLSEFLLFPTLSSLSLSLPLAHLTSAIYYVQIGFNIRVAYYVYVLVKLYHLSSLETMSLLW